MSKKIATAQGIRAKYDGRSSLPEYKIWKGMVSRCYCKTDSAYKKYGGRGITVCDRWRGINGFSNFLLDMGAKKDGESIDRIDVNGNYSPSNCRWADIETQSNNKRNSVLLSAFGKKQSLSQWSRETGVHRKTIKWRLANGWETSRALSEKHQRGFNGRNY